MKITLEELNILTSYISTTKLKFGKSTSLDNPNKNIFSDVSKIKEDINNLLAALDTNNINLNELINNSSSQESHIDLPSTVLDIEYQSKHTGKDLAEHEYDLANYICTDINDLEQNLELAVILFLSSAKRCFIEAQNKIAEMYEIGDGVTQNKTKACEWFTKAADQGHPCSQVSLGLMYELGDGVEINVKKALEWFTKAADQGDAAGQYNLATLYDYGYHEIHDDTKAFYWYEKAAKQDHADAQNDLASAYYYGLGTKQDYEKAFKYFLKSAGKECMEAQNNVAEMYRDGEGTKKSLPKAHKWFTKSADQGYKPAIKSLKSFKN